MLMDKRVVAWLLSCGLLPVMTTAILSPSLTGLHEEFQAEAQVGVLAKLVLTSPALAIAFGAGIIGMSLDRWGRRPILGLSLLGFAIFGCYGYWAKDLYSLIAVRFLFGFSVAGIMTTSATLLADISDGPSLRRVLGLQAALMGGWGITAQTIAGAMAEGNWRGPFLLYLVSLPLVIWMLALHKTSFTGLSASHATVSKDERMGPQWITAIIVLLSVAAMSLFSLVPVHGPLYFKQILHRGPRGTAFLISSLTAASSVSSLSLALWRGHLRSERLLILGFASITLSCFLLGFIPLFWVVWLGMLAMGMGIGLVIPCLQTWMAQRVKASERGRSLGMLTSANYIGQFLCPFWAQIFLSQGEHTALFQACTWIGAILMGATSILSFSRAWGREEVAADAVNAIHSLDDMTDQTAKEQHIQR